MNSVDLERVRGEVIGISINVGNMQTAVAQVAQWARLRESRAIFFCNAHVLAHARSNNEFRNILEVGDLRLPDGAPVAYILRRMGFEQQRRVSGPDLMLQYMALAEVEEEAVFLYGSTPSTLCRLQEQYLRDFPRLKVHAYSPPFRELTKEEDEDIVRIINQSRARTVWVALGCPKQEQWIAEHRGRIPAVLLGVGAAFAFHAGVASRAPNWMQKYGLEWLHRLITDPRRLWKRYLITNTIFLVYAVSSVLQRKRTSTSCEYGEVLRSNRFDEQACASHKSVERI